MEVNLEMIFENVIFDIVFGDFNILFDFEVLIFVGCSVGGSL